MRQPMRAAEAHSPGGPNPERVCDGLAARHLIAGTSAHQQGTMERDLATYLPLVRRVVQNVARRLPANVQRDDLLAAGVCGLADSLRRNGGDSGEGFAWYARVRIRGAIFDELRAQDWLPRRLRDRLSSPDDGAPTSFVSFDEVVGEHAELAGDDDPSAAVEASWQRRALARALLTLSEREQVVVARYYFDGARLREISHELGVSEPRISQILSRAVGRLRELLLAEAS